MSVNNAVNLFTFLPGVKSEPIARKLKENWPFSSCLKPHETKAKCKVIILQIRYHSYANFHMKSFAFSLTFMTRFTATRKKPIGGFHVTSSPPCWWTKTIDLSVAPFVRPPAFVHFTIVICVSRDWLKTTYCNENTSK